MDVFSRKERDRQLRRADIFKAAEHLFAVKGYHKATIRDIAKQAQYAIGTVYLHFKDKDALYLSLFEEKMKCMMLVVEEKMSAGKDARSKLEIYVRETLAYFEDNLDFFGIFISEGGDTLSMETKLRNTPFGQRFEGYLTDLIRQAQEERVISKDLDPKQVCDIFIAILKTIVLEWFTEGQKGKKSLVDQTDVILRYLLSGASNK